MSGTNSTREAEATPFADRHGFLRVDGAPRLVLGMYELPADDEVLAGLARSGFNLVRVPNRAALDRVHHHGLYGWVCVDPRPGADEVAGQLQLAQTVEALKDHPGLLVWELPDEVVWNVWWDRMDWVLWSQRPGLQAEVDRFGAGPERVGEWETRLARAQELVQRGLFEQAEALFDALWRELGRESPYPEARFSTGPATAEALTLEMARGCRMLRQLDPAHPIWQNHAPRNALARLRWHNRMVDAAGCDIYPAPIRSTGHSDLRDVSLAAVGAFTDRMRAAAPGRSVWMVLQGFGWRDIEVDMQASPDQEKGRRPTASESRFMAYDALVHGANALLWWGTHAIEKDSDLWRDLMAVSREIRALEPALVGARPRRQPRAVADETYGSIDPEQGPRVLLCRVGRDWLLIAANEEVQGVSFEVTGLPKALEGQTLHRLRSDESHRVQEGRFRDGIRSCDAHVYATSRRFEVDAGWA